MNPCETGECKDQLRHNRTVSVWNCGHTNVRWRLHFQIRLGLFLICFGFVSCSLLILLFSRHHSHHSGLVLYSLPILQLTGEPRQPSSPYRSLLVDCFVSWAQQLAHRVRQPVPSRGPRAPVRLDVPAWTWTEDPDCSSVLLFSGDHVLPDPLCPPRGVPPAP